MQKKWLPNYPDGVPAEIDPKEYATLIDVFKTSVERFRDLPAFTNMGTTLSYARIDQLSRDFAAYLQKELGLKKGERLAIMMPNLLQFPVALFGALRAGLVVVNTNPLYTARELRHQLVDSGASAIVVLENFAHVVAKVVPDTQLKMVITTQLGSLLSSPKSTLVNFVVKYIKKMVPDFSLSHSITFKQALAIGAKHELGPVDIGFEDLAFLQYTGGTTGAAKGAMLTHRNMVVNLLQAKAWVSPLVKDSSEVVITALPLYHIFALLSNCLLFTLLGGTNYLITNPRDMKGFVKELKRVRFTAIVGVNTLFNGLLTTPGFDDLDFSNLKVALGGGMSVQRDVAERWKETTGNTLVEAYGLTEASPAVCINPIDLAEYNGLVGLPIPSTECHVKDENGAILEDGEAGELYVRGPQVMKGYWNNPEQTEEAIDQDGWLRTGDIAVINDQGYVKLVDRKNDLIIVSGFNVYPTEIEDVVSTHPGVHEIAAVGIPDAHSGEVVKLFIVKKDEALTAEEIIHFCRESLTGYKRPKLIEFRDELPKTNVGKVLRRALRG